MSNTVTAIRKSAVILFSFAFIAIILTMINVGVNESGNSSLSSVTAAHASGQIGYGGSSGGSFTPPSVGGCIGGCPAPLPAGQSSGGVGAITDSTVKSTYYTCNNVNASGVCTVNNVVESDALVRSEYCAYYMWNNGVVVATSGPGAVQYLKNRLIGNWFNGANAAERMFHHLTGYDLGWAPYLVGWSDVGNWYYNGTTWPAYEGSLKFDCKKYTQVDYAHYTLKNTVCYPKYDGRPFPYAVGYYVTYKNLDNRTVAGKDNYDWAIRNESCVYVNSSTPPPKVADGIQKCYWNINHSGYFSTNRSAILNGGTTTTNRPVSPYQGAVQPYISGSNSTARVNNCTQSIRMDANLSLADGYAYYRLQGSANYQLYQYYIWDPAYTRGQRLQADIVPAGTGVETKKVYGTHSCQTNPPYREYPSWGSLPNISFNYSDCGRNKNWTCKIPHGPYINGAANSVEVMRDGTYLPTDLAGVNVAGAGVRDSSTKQVGTVADGNMSYMVNVVSGSSPFDGTDANASKQYFELWKGDKTTETRWGTWISQPNANKNSYLTYYWSSDNGLNWKMNYKAQLNSAEFSVPFQNGSLEAPTTKWMRETNIDCDGTKTSNAATVLRSVTSEG